MKKSKLIVLGSVFMVSLSVTSCNNKPKNEWISGKSGKKDTVMNDRGYRYYGGSWYPLFNNRINPGIYSGFTNSALRSGVTPSVIKSGGFGSSARSGFSSFGG
ncbi:hypothetical protein [Amniculibacterium sp. G2-70]|uniref:hypothetical protein n=1 Tax=Amniculibacterium sp. G2-70 TaxID=2767188 RepID=UPI0016547285|nr:hypothetical protein [Amniculibacterium sp. G2-70]